MLTWMRREGLCQLDRFDRYIQMARWIYGQMDRQIDRQVDWREREREREKERESEKDGIYREKKESERGRKYMERERERGTAEGKEREWKAKCIDQRHVILKGKR